MCKRMLLRLVPFLAEQLEKISKEQGLSMNALITQMLWNFVGNWNEKIRNYENENK